MLVASTVLFIALFVVGCGQSPNQVHSGQRDFSTVVPHDATYVIDTQNCTSANIHGRTVCYPNVLAYQNVISERMFVLSDSAISNQQTADTTSSRIIFSKWEGDRSAIDVAEQRLSTTEMTPEKERMLFMEMNSFRNSLVDINIDRIRNGQWYGIVVTRFFAQPMLKTDLVMITADLHEASTNNIIMVQMRIVKEAITVVQAKSVIASIIAGAEQ